MDEILNHGYVEPKPPPHHSVLYPMSSRADDDARVLGGDLVDEFKPEDNVFGDYGNVVRAQKKHYVDHVAQRGALGAGLLPPSTALGGHDITGHHIERGTRSPAVGGLPNIPGPGPRDPDAPRLRRGGDQTWVTTARAQMEGGTEEAAGRARRTGKRMMGGGGGGGGAGRRRRRAGGALSGHPNAGPFGYKHAALAERSDALHNQVDRRGGLGLETTPFPPGYGGHVPMCDANLGVMVNKSLAPRADRSLLVENHHASGAAVGCTKFVRR